MNKYDLSFHKNGVFFVIHTQTRLLAFLGPKEFAYVEFAIKVPPRRFNCRHY